MIWHYCNIFNFRFFNASLQVILSSWNDLFPHPQPFTKTLHSKNHLLMLAPLCRCPTPLGQNNCMPVWYPHSTGLITPPIWHFSHWSIYGQVCVPLRVKYFKSLVHALPWSELRGAPEVDSHASVRSHWYPSTFQSPTSVWKYKQWPQNRGTPNDYQTS